MEHWKNWIGGNPEFWLSANPYVDRIKIIIKILNEPATHFGSYHGTIITHSVYSPVYVCIFSINKKRWCNNKIPRQWNWGLVVPTVTKILQFYELGCLITKNCLETSCQICPHASLPKSPESCKVQLPLHIFCKFSANGKNSMSSLRAE